MSNLLHQKQHERRQPVVVNNHNNNSSCEHVMAHQLDYYTGDSYPSLLYHPRPDADAFGRRPDVHGNGDHNDSQALPLHPQELWHRVLAYVQCGLIASPPPPSPHHNNPPPPPSSSSLLSSLVSRPLSIVLHGLHKWPDPQRSHAPMAHEWYQDLLVWLQQQQQQQRYSHSTTDDNDQDEPAADSSGLPQEALYYSLMELWATSGIPQQTCQRVQEYWDATTLQQQQQSPHSPPSPSLYCVFMEAQARGTTPQQAWSRIQALWKELHSTLHNSENKNGRNHTRIYNRVIHAMTVCRLPESVQAAHSLLQDMCESLRLQQDPSTAGKNKDPPDEATAQLLAVAPIPSRSTFHMLLSAYGQMGQVDQAVALWKRMQGLGQYHDFLQPNHQTWVTLLWVFAQAGDVQRAHEMTHYIVADWEQQHYAQSSSSSLSSSRPMSLQRVPQLTDTKWDASYDLQDRDDYDFHRAPKLNWNLVWEGVLVAWASSRHPQAGDHVARIIQQLQSMSAPQHSKSRTSKATATATSTNTASITTSTLNKVLGCYALQGTPQSTQQAQELFDWMKGQQPGLWPDSESYFSLILAWCKSHQPYRAQAVLKELCDKVQAGTFPTSALEARHFNIVLDAWSKHRRPAKGPSPAGDQSLQVWEWMQSMRPTLQPDVVSYTSLLLALARGNSTIPTTRQVEAIFQEMQHDYHENGNVFCKPNAWTYNAVLWALGQSRDRTALDRAQTLFDQLDPVDRHNAKLYNTLMAAWMKRGNPEKVEALFQEMKQSAADTDKDRTESQGPRSSWKPHFKAHTTRLQAWSKAGNPYKATEALQDWIALCESERGATTTTTTTTTAPPPTPLPGTQEFNAVLIAWLRSKETAAAAQRADRGLQQMIQLSQSGRFPCPPNLQSYTTVISAHARYQTPQAGTRAMALLQQLKEQQQEQQEPLDDATALEPDFFVYASVLSALLRSYQHVDASHRPQHEQDIQELLQEVQDKNASFWKMDTDKNRQQVRSLIRKLGQQVQECSSMRREAKWKIHLGLKQVKEQALASSSLSSSSSEPPPNL